jgi:hypothetical protein
MWHMDVHPVDPCLSSQDGPVAFDFGKCQAALRSLSICQADLMNSLEAVSNLQPMLHCLGKVRGRFEGRLGEALLSDLSAIFPVMPHMMSFTFEQQPHCFTFLEGASHLPDFGTMTKYMIRS